MEDDCDSHWENRCQQNHEKSIGRDIKLRGVRHFSSRGDGIMRRQVGRVGTITRRLLALAIARKLFQRYGKRLGTKAKIIQLREKNV